MIETFPDATIPAVLFALTLVFGFWLSRAGKPYDGVLFNAHKLTALVAVVLSGIRIYRTPHPLDWLFVVLSVFSAVCVIVLFASGALMGAEKSDYILMLTIHRVTLTFLAVSLGLAVLMEALL